MDPSASRGVAATAGLAFAAFAFAGLPMYFTYSGAPPDWNVLTRVLLGALGLVALLVFALTWGHALGTALPGREWIAALAVVPLLVQIGLTFVHFSMEAGTVLVTPEPIDPTRDGVLAPAQFLLQGSFGRLLTAVFLIASARAILLTQVLPRWTATAAVIVGVVQLAFVPTLFFAPDPSQFYGSVGWGATAFAPAFLVAWVAAVSVSILRAQRSHGRARDGHPLREALGAPHGK